MLASILINNVIWQFYEAHGKKMWLYSANVDHRNATNPEVR